MVKETRNQVYRNIVRETRNKRYYEPDSGSDSGRPTKRARKNPVREHYSQSPKLESPEPESPRLESPVEMLERLSRDVMRASSAPPESGKPVEQAMERASSAPPVLDRPVDV